MYSFFFIKYIISRALPGACSFKKKKICYSLCRLTPVGTAWCGVCCARCGHRRGCSSTVKGGRRPGCAATPAGRRAPPDLGEEVGSSSCAPPASTTERLPPGFVTTSGDDIFILFSPMSSTQFQRLVSSWLQSADSLTPKTGSICTSFRWTMHVSILATW